MPQPVVIEHHIQRTILQKLAGGPLRFSALKPDGLVSNVFAYHLNALCKKQFVQKSGDEYRLAPAGLTYIDRLSAANLALRHQPKVIAVLVVQNAKGQFAMLRRKTEPYMGSVMLPSGKMHYGETLTAHAERELLDKTGLRAKLEYRGIASILIAQGEQALTQAVAAVWHAKIGATTLHTADDRFEAVWLDGPFTDAMPGTNELLEYALHAPLPFMADLELQM